ncbi:MAG TPA: alginate export family protein, partial [Pseudomonadales bacterium]|nr:alginate export family protein [Pseudomonadales bacterium]
MSKLRNTRNYVRIGAALAIVGTAPTLVHAAIADAMTSGKSVWDFRLRDENVDDDAPAAKALKQANAVTLRSRLTYTSGIWEDFVAVGEFDNVSEVVDSHYNDTINGKTEYSNISDPVGTEVNQAFISYYGLKGTLIGWGRQRINLDNQRFVGGAAWRQNEQTYDAFTVDYKGIKQTRIYYAFINNANRVFGESSASGDDPQHTHILNATYMGLPVGTVTAYLYNFDDEGLPTFGNRTMGVRAAGTVSPFNYTLEYAAQREAGDNPTKYDAKYYLVQAGYAKGDYGISLAQEKLGADHSDGNKGMFITPYATLHAFQGWADKFLNGGLGNIEQGIIDSYLVLTANVAGLKTSLNYHSYKADESTSTIDKLGKEWGVEVAKQFNNNYGLALKYASYKADDFSWDTNKVWLTATAKF